MLPGKYPIREAVNRIVEAAGPNPATTCEVEVSTLSQHVVGDDGEPDMQGMVRFHAKLPSGEKFLMEDHYVSSLHAPDLERLQSVVSELWKPGAVDALLLREGLV